MVQILMGSSGTAFGLHRAGSPGRLATPTIPASRVPPRGDTPASLRPRPTLFWKKGKPTSLAISPQTEALLTAEARRQGISVDALQRKLVEERISAEMVWPLVLLAASTAATFTTMSLEPGIIDSNVLAYAMDASAPQHVASRAVRSALYASQPCLRLLPGIRNRTCASS